MPRTKAFEPNEVLENAMLLFWKQGYHGSSMQDITVATGLNRSSLYNTFGGKMQLYQAALARYQKRSHTIFQKALMTAGNPREAIALIFDGFVKEINNREEGMGCFSAHAKHEMNSDSAIRNRLLLEEEQQLSFFEELLADGQERGSINGRQTAGEYAYVLYNTLQGMKTVGILQNDAHRLEAIVQVTLRSLR
ncbi:TetR/AcrR family transcriptional regulator [Altibacter sp. HG106]|uniref:TetR/AcrR family transcriptional regulator n=1 Tax=Altibacter sp. HG106 TaxID=3023937 RepID=UPI002350AA5D|nr:TetR/AcrR family transcriptional regulator [Altibacter sp. HG106]MDC7994846.1 TetR/AcrR family transcriptional regulator [Altibacter sp. HG106]